MSKEHSVSSNALILIVSKILNTLLTLISSMLLSRFRSLSEYGTYSQLHTVIGLFLAILLLGLPNSMNYFVARADSQEQKDRFLSIYYIFSTALSLLCGLILIILCPFISEYYHNKNIINYKFVLLVLPWAQVIITSVGNMLVATNKTRKLLVYNLLRSASTLIAIILIKLFGKTFRDYMILYVVIEGAFALWVYYETYKLIEKIYVNIDLKLIRRILSFSIPMGIASAIGTLDIYLDNLMIGYYFDTETLAVYANAARELPFNIIASAFTAVLITFMAKELKNGNVKKAISLWHDAIEFNAIILFFCSMACVVFAPQIVVFLYSEKYIDGSNVFRIYSLIIMLRITYYGMILNSIGKTKGILYSSVVTLISNIILNFILINTIGIIGAAIATMLSMVIGALFQLYLSSKTINIRLGELFPWRRLFNLFLINAALGFALYVVLKSINLGTSVRDIAISICIGSITLGVYTVLFFKKIKYLYRNMNK